jgi:hypothetical protein
LANRDHPPDALHSAQSLGRLDWGEHPMALSLFPSYFFTLEIIFADTANYRKAKPQTTMTKLINITLAAVTLCVVSSCNTSKKAPAAQSKSMPGMSAAEHARM